MSRSDAMRDVPKGTPDPVVGARPPVIAFLSCAVATLIAAIPGVFWLWIAIDASLDSSKAAWAPLALAFSLFFLTPVAIMASALIRLLRHPQAGARRMITALCVVVAVEFLAFLNYSHSGLTLLALGPLVGMLAAGVGVVSLKRFTLRERDVERENGAGAGH